MGFKRADRVSEAIKREVSVLLTQGIKDPGVHFVTVTLVDVAEDLRNAIIYVSVLGTEQDAEETMKGLERAKGYVRKELGARLQLRYTPEIHFKRDDSLDNSLKIRNILNELKSEEKPKNEEQ
ncbi:MAG TPA: 30S ribosome-binding factor RbfA [bacterium]|jgi:ribosome-binding factor A|nr:30S ribosome-binding factor RbfA [bacterium]